MMAVPRKPRPPVSDEAGPVANGSNGTAEPNGVHAESNGVLKANGAESAAPAGPDESLAIVETSPELAPALPAAPEQPPDPGLYAVLGLDPSVSDALIQTTYRRQAARLLNGSSGDFAAMRQLNAAYEVIGNPVRRAEYDRARLNQSLVPAPPTPVRQGPKVDTGPKRRSRPRHVVQPRYAGLGDVFVVLAVVGLAVVAGALIIPRLSINLSALNALSNVLPSSGTQRRVIDATVTPAPTVLVTPTVRPGLAQRYAGSTVGVSDPTPAQNGQENVLVKLRRDGQPAANTDVWATVQYRTTQERWPASGSVKTDANGSATISFNIGGATPNYAVQVHVFAQADDQQLTWSTSFTPR
jgi:DnaJ-like protein